MWARLDDGFGDHPKVARLSDRAFRTHVLAMCYAARHLTDGGVPASQGPSRGIAAELIKAGLWEPAEDGWRLHDWQDYNPPAETVEQRRKSARERQRRRRDRDERGRFTDEGKGA